MSIFLAFQRVQIKLDLSDVANAPRVYELRQLWFCWNQWPAPGASRASIDQWMLSTGIDITARRDIEPPTGKSTCDKEAHQ